MGDIRSLRSDDVAYIRFFNCTERKVDVTWIDFSGSYVSYRLLNKGQFFDVTTYKTHPWIAYDCKTKDRMHTGKEFIYFPKTAKEYLKDKYPHLVPPPEFETIRVRVPVTLPVYSLRYRCLLAVRDFLKDSVDLEKLDLPKELAEDLRKVIAQRNAENMRFPMLQ